MKVIGKRVLVKQVATKRKTKVYTGTDGDKKDTHIVQNTIEAIGDLVENPECKIGDTPVFGNHVSFDNVKILSQTEDVTVAHIIVHYEEIVGIDNPEVLEN